MATRETFIDNSGDDPPACDGIASHSEERERGGRDASCYRDWGKAPTVVSH